MAATGSLGFWRKASIIMRHWRADVASARLWHGQPGARLMVQAVEPAAPCLWMAVRILGSRVRPRITLSAPANTYVALATSSSAVDVLQHYLDERGIQIEPFGARID